MSWMNWGRYVPVAERRAKARKKMEKLRKKGLVVQPIEIEGRKIAKSFWGQSWCQHLESFSDYENRLPRGRTYARNGSVCHLEIQKGLILAKVMGSSLYEIRVRIQPLAKKRWKQIKTRCAGQIASLLELLQGSLSDGVMEIVTDPQQGLFPEPHEIELDCDCPDWAELCKHLAAVLYGVGARLDERPELLFLLRGVDHHELVAQDADRIMEGSRPGKSQRIAQEDLSEIFGLEMVEDSPPGSPAKKARPAKNTRKPKPRSTKPANTKRAKAKPAKARPPKTTKTTRPPSPRSHEPIEGRFVRELRLWLGMTGRDFAKLLSVSTATISNWESRSQLSLHERNEQALRATARLSKKRAWEKLAQS